MKEGEIERGLHDLRTHTLEEEDQEEDRRKNFAQERTG